LFQLKLLRQKTKPIRLGSSWETLLK